MSNLYSIYHNEKLYSRLQDWRDLIVLRIETKCVPSSLATQSLFLSAAAFPPPHTVLALNLPSLINVLPSVSSTSIDSKKQDAIRAINNDRKRKGSRPGKNFARGYNTTHFPFLLLPD